MSLDRALRALARFVFAHRRAIVGVTALAVVGAGVFGAQVTQRTSQGGFDASTEQSIQAATVLQDDLHAGQPNLVLLVTAPRGSVDSPGVAAVGRALTARLAAEPDMANVMSYWSLDSVPVLRTADRSQALIVGRIVGNQDQIVRREPAVVAGLGHIPNTISVRAGGFGPAFQAVNTVVEHDLVRAELIAIPITAVLLLFVFGSAIAALMPLTIAGVAVVGTLAVLRLLTSFTPVSVFAVNLTTALGLGLAIDYSLFVVSRFREELAAGHGVEPALETTLATAGRTVAGSALTVAAALSALLVFPLMFLKSFAYAGIAVSLLAGLAATIVLPAILGLLGHRVNAVTVWRRSIHPPAIGFWSRTAGMVMRRPVVVIVVVVGALAVLASPFLGLKLGYLDYRVLPPSNPVRQTNDLLTAEFGTGQSGALAVVAPGVKPSQQAEVVAYGRRLSRLSGVARVDTEGGIFVHGVGVPIAGAYLSQFRSDHGTWLSVVPSVDPLSAAGEHLVQDVRAGPAPFPILVGGTPAQFVDSTAVITSRLPLALGLIAAVSFLLLLILFRSLLIPIKALVLNVLSLSATFGAMVWIFQQGHLSHLLDFTATGSLTATMPILMFCVAFGLSMDYEVFLISRIKERHDRGYDNRDAVATGLQQTGRIVTAAALLMSVVFLGVVTSGISFMKLFGVGLTLAVLMDAFVIRGLLVPAFMRLAGRANWWAPRFIRGDDPRLPGATAGDREAPPPRTPQPVPALLVPDGSRSSLQDDRVQ
jgi:RND superfamily putative drug exporter